MGSRRAGGTLGPRRSLLILMNGHVREGSRPQHRIVQWVERAQLHCQIDVSPTLRGSSHQRFTPRSRVDALRIVWTNARRALEPDQARVQVTVKPEGPTHGEVDKRIHRIEFEPAFREATRLGNFPAKIIRVPHKCSLEVDEVETCVGASEMMIQRNSALEQ